MPVQDKKPVTGFFVIYSSLAQSVERSAVNRNVVGSSPTGGAIFLNPSTSLKEVEGFSFFITRSIDCLDSRIKFC